MSAGPEGRAPGPAISSPELALVDPELRALAVERAHAPPSIVRPDAASVVPPFLAPVVDGDLAESPVADRDVTEADGDLTEAMRRLAELADVDPPERRLRSTRALGITFAATAWLVLAVVVADMQLWRL